MCDATQKAVREANKVIESSNLSEWEEVQAVIVAKTGARIPLSPKQKEVAKAYEELGETTT